MKIKIHASAQDDVDAETVFAIHARSTDGNRSTRLFGVYRSAPSIYQVEFGGEFARRFVAHEVAYWRGRLAGLVS